MGAQRAFSPLPSQRNVYNQTGEKITEIVMDDIRRVFKMVAKPEEDERANGQAISFSERIPDEIMSGFL